MPKICLGKWGKLSGNGFDLDTWRTQMFAGREEMNWDQRQRGSSMGKLMLPCLQIPLKSHPNLWSLCARLEDLLACPYQGEQYILEISDIRFFWLNTLLMLHSPSSLILFSSGSQNVVPGTPAAAAPGNLLAMPSPRPCSRFTKLKIQQSGLISPPGDSDTHQSLITTAGHLLSSACFRTIKLISTKCLFYSTLQVQHLGQHWTHSRCLIDVCGEKEWMGN